jgi:hypothetical protein
MLNLFRKESNLLVHDARIKLPATFKKNTYWDGIILGPTFLSQRSSQFLNKIKKEYQWVKDATSVKIALPQDDYDCSEILDDWLVDWKIDHCITPMTKHLKILYPKFSKVGILTKGYTAYVSEEWIEKWATVKPTEQRSIDISYRATKLPANFGSLGNLKSEIAEIFTKKLSGFNKDLKIDISCRPEDKIYGNRWHDFLENSKFTLATPSGSSLIDPTGGIRECVSSQTNNKSFAQIANNCFPGSDNRYVFDCIGPRHIEAALAGTVMIATEGEYSNVLVAGENYIKLEKDCSNIDEILDKISDPFFVNQIMLKAKERILSIPELRLSWIATKCFNWIPDKKDLKSTNSYIKMLKTMKFKVFKFYTNVKTSVFWIFFRKIVLIYRIIMKLI